MKYQKLTNAFVRDSKPQKQQKQKQQKQTKSVDNKNFENMNFVAHSSDDASSNGSSPGELHVPLQMSDIDHKMIHHAAEPYEEESSDDSEDFSDTNPIIRMV